MDVVLGSKAQHQVLVTQGTESALFLAMAAGRIPWGASRTGPTGLQVRAHAPVHTHRAILHSLP